MYITDKEKMYSFRNTEIAPVELLGFQSHASLNNSTSPFTLSDVTTITIPQLYNLVKTYNKSVMRYIRRLQQ